MSEALIHQRSTPTRGQSWIVRQIAIARTLPGRFARLALVVGIANSSGQAVAQQFDPSLERQTFQTFEEACRGATDSSCAAAITQVFDRLSGDLRGTCDVDAFWSTWENKHASDPNLPAALWRFGVEAVLDNGGICQELATPLTGVVVAPLGTITAMAGTRPTSSPLETVRDGARVAILKTEGPFYQVRIVDGGFGWLPIESVAVDQLIADGWGEERIQIAHLTNAGAALSTARQFYSPVSVYADTDGGYAVVLRQGFSTELGRTTLSTLLDAHVIPEGSLLTSGSTFTQQVCCGQIDGEAQKAKGSITVLSEKGANSKAPTETNEAQSPGVVISPSLMASSPELAAVVAKAIGDYAFPLLPEDQGAYLKRPGVAEEYSAEANRLINQASKKYDGNLGAALIALHPDGGDRMARAWLMAPGANDASLPKNVREFYQETLNKLSGPVRGQRAGDDWDVQGPLTDADGTQYCIASDPGSSLYVRVRAPNRSYDMAAIVALSDLHITGSSDFAANSAPSLLSVEGLYTAYYRAGLSFFSEGGGEGDTAGAYVWWYDLDEHMLDAIRRGLQLQIMVGTGVDPAKVFDFQSAKGPVSSFSLAGSAAALAELEHCIEGVAAAGPAGAPVGHDKKGQADAITNALKRFNDAPTDIGFGD